MDLRQLSVDAAIAGAAVVAAAFGSRHAATMKSDDSPVTEVDAAAEAAVLRVLDAAVPNDAVVSEEGSGRPGTTGRRWYIDPLDGTVNFMNGIPHVGVSIAVYDDDGPLAASVVDPLRPEVFHAARGEGAELGSRRIGVSDQAELRNAVVVTGFPYDHRRRAAELLRPIQALLEQVQGVRRLGSAALDLAWVAAGRFDVYYEPAIAPWDTAAGILIVNEAGGVVSDLAGRPSTPEMFPIVASNGLLHDEVIDLVAPFAPAARSDASE